MNRKDMDILARAVKRGWPDTVTGTQGREARAWVAKTLANGLEKEIAGFDRLKFLERCGFEGAI